MIQYIKGTLAWIAEDSVIVDNHGIGYRIFVPASVSQQIGTTGQEIQLYTYLNVKEDAMQLYGFLTMDDLEVYRLLISVSGIGPKGGLAILSVMTADDLRFAVLADDDKSISKAPGIGPKTAKKVVLELQDKLKLRETVETALDHGQQAVLPAGSGLVQTQSDVVEALAALGYSATEAMKAVRRVECDEDISVEELLKKTLRYM